MKFINRYIEPKEDIIKTDKLLKCSICGELTYYIELCSEAPFCSDECLAEFYRQYWEVERKFS